MTAAYNMSVHEVNLAVIKQTLNKQLCDEVLCGYEREPIFRITALYSTPQWTSWICLLNTVFSSPTGNQEEHDQKWVRNYIYIVLVC